MTAPRATRAATALLSPTRRLALWLLAAGLPALAAAAALFGWRMHDTLLALWSERNHLAAQEAAQTLVEAQAQGTLLPAAAQAVFAARSFRSLTLINGDVVLLQLQAPTSQPRGFALAAPEPGRSALAWPATVSAADRTATQVQVRTTGDDLQEALRTSLSLVAALLLGLACAGIALVLWWARSAQGVLSALVTQVQAMQRGEYATGSTTRGGVMRVLARELNALARRLRAQVHDQAEQVAHLQRLAHTDAVSGAPLRAPFLRHLEAMLAGEGAPPATLLIMRLPGLGLLNETQGRDAADHVLAALGDVLLTYAERVPGAAVGRLNGIDFALALPMSGVASETAEAIAHALASTPPARLASVGLVIGGCDALTRMPIGNALALADQALAEAELRGQPVLRSAATVGDADADECPAHADRGAAEDGSDDTRGATGAAGESAVEPGAADGSEAATEDGAVRGRTAAGARALREQLAQALDAGRARLAEYPVLAPDGRLLHLECPLRLQLQPGGEFLHAHRWLAPAARGRLLPQVDLAGLELALAALARDAQPRSVHVSMRSFRQPAFAATLQARLEAAGSERAARLWLEWTELEGSAFAPEAEALRRALPGWRRLGIKVGVEHAGASPQALAALAAFGLDFVKVDARHVAGVAESHAVREYARSLVVLLHGLGVAVYAEGADRAEDLSPLWSLGFDGATGAAVRIGREALVPA